MAAEACRIVRNIQALCHLHALSTPRFHVSAAAAAIVELVLELRWHVQSVLRKILESAPSPL